LEPDHRVGFLDKLGRRPPGFGSRLPHSPHDRANAGNKILGEAPHQGRGKGTFPGALSAKMDLDAVGKELAKRKEELMAEMQA
jgi:hypothetical protein